MKLIAFGSWPGYRLSRTLDFLWDPCWQPLPWLPSDPVAYQSLLVGDGVTLVAAWLIFTLRNVGGVGKGKKERSALTPMRDLKFLALTSFNGILAMNLTILTVGIPLWVAEATDAPKAIAPLLIAVNTVMAIALQVPLSRRADTVNGAGLCMRRSGLCLALTCGALALAAKVESLPAAAALLTAVLLLTLGEIWHAAGGWGLQFGLSPEAERGSYAAVFSLGTTTQSIVGPSVIAMLAVGLGTAGWLALAAVFLGSGVAAEVVARRADAQLRHKESTALSRGPAMTPGAP